MVLSPKKAIHKHSPIYVTYCSGVSSSWEFDELILLYCGQMNLAQLQPVNSSNNRLPSQVPLERRKQKHLHFVDETEQERKNRQI
jgi:hypothetical protein